MGRIPRRRRYDRIYPRVTNPILLPKAARVPAPAAAAEQALALSLGQHQVRSIIFIFANPIWEEDVCLSFASLIYQ